MWLGWVLVGTLLGAILGWEKSAFHDDPTYSKSNKSGSVKILSIIWLAFIIAISTKTIRGFFIVFLSKLGAYYITKPIGEWLQKRWYRLRDPHPEVKIKFSNQDMEKLIIQIQVTTSTRVHLDSIYLLNGSDIVEIREANNNYNDLDIDDKGNIEFTDFIIRGKGLSFIELITENWSYVEICRIWGRYSNGVSWCVSKNIH